MVRSGLLRVVFRAPALVVGPLSNRLIDELLEAGLVRATQHVRLTRLRLQVEFAAFLVRSSLPSGH